MLTIVAKRALDKLRGHAEILILPVMAILAITPFGRLYADHRYLVLAAGAALVAMLTAALVSPKWPLPGAIAAEVVVAFCYLALFVFHSFGPANVWNGVTQSWSSLLTSSLPAVSGVPFVVLPVALCFLATSAAVEVALRSRWRAGPVLPPVGALVVGLLVTGKLSMPPLWLTTCIVLLAMLTVLLRAQRWSDGRDAAIDAQGRHGSLAAMSGLPFLVVIAVVATGLGSVLPVTSPHRRVDLRDRYNPPVRVSDAITPLAELQSQLTSPSRTPVFSVRFSGVPAGTKIDRVPVAILDTYDGAVWGTDASFALVGHQMPAGPTVPVAGPVVRQQYQVGSDGSSFLPALERPVEATGHSLVFDRVSGMIATATPAPAGFSYTVDSELPNLGHVAAEPVKSGNDPHFSALALAPPQGWPAQIVAFANGITGKGPYATLQAVANELRSRDFGYSSSARPGHSLGILSAFLAPPTSLNQVSTARVGDAEQFAAAFAVIARIKGFPSRVLVGYKVNPTAAGKGALIQVLPNQISAWAEVDLNGIGWVTFDPTNTQPRHSTVRSAPPPPSPPAPVGVANGNNGQGHGTNANGRAGHDHSSAWWIFIPVVLLLLPVVVVAAKRIRRRRRASSGSPLSRVVGAWREARDRLRLHVESKPVIGDDLMTRSWSRPATRWGMTWPAGYRHSVRSSTRPCTRPPSLTRMPSHRRGTPRGRCAPC